MKKPDIVKENARKRIIELIDEFAGEDPDRKQQAFADLCGVSKYSISQYVNGSNAPGNMTAAKIASKCGVDPLWVMGFDVKKRAVSDSERFEAYADTFNATHPELPTVEEKEHFNAYCKLSKKYRDQVDAITNQLITIQEQERELKKAKMMKCYTYYRHIAAAGTGVYFETIPTETMDAYMVEGADFIIGVSGDSMEPTFYDGDNVYVKKTHDISVGDIGIFLVNNECYIKEAGKDELISHNPKYKPISGRSEVYCVGKVLGKVM